MTAAALLIAAQLLQAQAEIDEIGRVLAALKDPRAAQAACAASFSAETLLEATRTGLAPAALFVALPDARAGLASHLACRALAADDPALCAPLEPLAAAPVGVPSTGVPLGLPAHYLCRRDYHSWAYDLSRLGGGKDFQKRCLDENGYRWAGDEGPFRPDGWGLACAALAEHRAGRADAARTCASLAPLFVPPVAAAECERRVQWFFGENAALCDGLRSSVAQARCREIATLKSTLAKGEVPRRDCTPALETARAAYCGRFNREYASSLHADLSVLLERASELIGEASARGGPAHPQAARLAALETRRQDLAAALGVEGPRDPATPELPGAAFAAVDLDLAAAALAGVGGRCDQQHLEEYFACQARFLGAPTVCGALDLPEFKNTSYPPAYRCRHNFLMWSADFARISGSSDSPDRCVAENYYRWRDPFDGGPFKPGAFREGCGIIADYSVRGADLRETCERIMPVYRYSTSIPECMDRFRYAHGQDLRLCATLKNPTVKLDRCQGLAALRGALRDGKPCGGSKYCRMQTALSPESCGAYLDAARAAGCASSGPSEEPLERAERKLRALTAVPADQKARRERLLLWLRGGSAR